MNNKLVALKARFPEGMDYQVTWDSTTFVKDTIAEVLRTLGEAFVLVVIVVFLFLGNLRATIIPTIAVPVSLIGAFSVLLAMGFSANTVSLLAMVLAIGIVVDDAIVVVENVERVLEEHPELSVADATKQAMREITAPILAITLVLLSVFVPIAFIPGISGVLFQQFAVTICIFHADFGAERADAVAGAVRGVPGATNPGRGAAYWAASAAASTGRARATRMSWRGWVRFAAFSIIIIAVFAVGIAGMSAITPTGFLPSEDQGGFFVSLQLPDGASVARTGRVMGRLETEIAKMPRCRRYLRDHRLLDPGFLAGAECRLHVRAPETLRRPARRSHRGWTRWLRGVFRPRRRHTLRQCSGAEPAADHRPGHHRRLRNTSSTRWRGRIPPPSTAPWAA